MRKVSIFTVLFVLLFAVTITAKETTQELPEYTTEQRWERASSQMTIVGGILAISYAKSLGHTAEEYGEYTAKLFGPGWGDPGTASLDIIGGVRLNCLLWSGSEFEIVKATETFVTGGVNRPWKKYFGEEKSTYGVSLDEYETWFRTFHRRLAEYKGLGYKDEIKGDWLYMTFYKE